MRMSMKLLFRKFFKVIKYLFITLAIISIALILSFYFLMKGSLPIESGEIVVQGLSNTVEVKRDSLGIPTIRGSNRVDIARATGFLHAQERFFQMDILRRLASGELSELVGAASVQLDKERRFHGFREIARESLKKLTAKEREVLSAYTEGVNEGLKALKVYPFEYLLLMKKPTDWQLEDSLLVGYELFFELQDSKGLYDQTIGYMKALLPTQVYEFFIKNGSFWEAALDHSRLPIINIPDQHQFDYLKKSDDLLGIVKIRERPELKLVGSNQWVVSSERSSTGKTILACDMHLPLSVPVIWYRAAFIYPNENGDEVRVDGATLPGTPIITVGSNGHIAWGFTDAYINTTDLILITLDPENSSNYLTPNGSYPFGKRIEQINVKGSSPIHYEVLTTIWGPVSEKKFLGQSFAVKWIAHEPDSINMRLQDLENVKDVAEAFNVLQMVKIPALNFTIADSKGLIGWTLLGSIPKRVGYDGTFPVSFMDESQKWLGPLEFDNYPKLTNPTDGFICTANNRILGYPWLDILGNGGFINSIRAYQIQKRLSELDQGTINDMLSIQLDDEALFFERWQQLMLDILTPEALEINPKRRELKEAIHCWDKHCSDNSLGYAYIREFRFKLADRILNRLLKPCYEAWDEFSYTNFDFEEPLWLIVSQKPSYLCDPKYGQWKDELLDTLDETIQQFQKTPSLLKKLTWGDVNKAKIQHVLSRAIPELGFFLDMPSDGLSGDFFVPRVGGGRTGASQRMIVSPGAENEGIFHMPCGQSGHPFSPHYCDSHSDWLKGNETPFLPGEAVHTLLLKSE